MSNGTDTKFIFCPRCGGLMEPPVCNICGYDLRMQSVQPGQEWTPPSENGDFELNLSGSLTPPNGANDAFSQEAQRDRVSEATLREIENINNSERKKKKILRTVIFGGIVIILLILIGPVLSVIRGYRDLAAARKRNASTQQHSATTQVKTSEEDSESIHAISGKRQFGRHNFEHDAFDLTFYEGMADISGVTRSGAFDPFINSGVESYRDQSSVFDISHKNYREDPSLLGPDYYEPFCDYINEISYSDQYGINREYYYYDDLMGGIRVQAEMAYVRLSGNIPNLEDLNHEIFARTASDFYNYLNGSSLYSQYVYSTITFSVDSYVTYNDGNKMSILLDAVVHTDDYMVNLDSYIYAINIDLTNGKIIENDEIVEFDEDFATEFRERCLTQNGRNSALDPWTDKEVKEFLNDKETNIVFFTPLGLEVGLCYQNEEDILSRGWMTITLKYGTFEKEYLKMDSLKDSGTETKAYSDAENAARKGTWIHIDPELAVLEEKYLKAAFPDYDWDGEIPDPADESARGNTPTSEETSEEASEETPGNPSEEPASEDPARNVLSKKEKDDAEKELEAYVSDSSKWLTSDKDIENYFEAIMPEKDTTVTTDPNDPDNLPQDIYDLYDLYGDKLAPYQYFILPKEKGIQ